MSGEWKSGICGCFDDCTVCIVTHYCPCYVLGKNADAVGESCVLCGASMFFHPVDLITRTMIRGKIREQKAIKGNCCGDFICHLFCRDLALCQEARELNSLSSGNSMARE